MTRWFPPLSWPASAHAGHRPTKPDDWRRRFATRSSWRPGLPCGTQVTRFSDSVPTEYAETVIFSWVRVSSEKCVTCVPHCIWTNAGAGFLWHTSFREVCHMADCKNKKGGRFSHVDRSWRPVKTTRIHPRSPESSRLSRCRCSVAVAWCSSSISSEARRWKRLLGSGDHSFAPQSWR